MAIEANERKKYTQEPSLCTVERERAPANELLRQTIRRRSKNAQKANANRKKSHRIGMRCSFVFLSHAN